jgi:uncharacterized Zn finger protein
MREPAASKGRRYLAEARLSVEHVDGDRIRATCRGDSGAIYELGFDPAQQEWHCGCPARGRCSHLTALMLVCVRRPA